MAVAAAVLKNAIGQAGFEALTRELGQTESYRMTEAQAEAVVRMQLGQLAALESDEILKEYRQLREQITGYEALLADDAQVRALIQQDLIHIRDKYGTPRLTEMTEDDGDLDFEELIADDPAVVTISHEGFIKRMPLDTFRTQHRGGKGVSGGTRDNDFIEHFFTTTLRSYLLCFTDRGQVYWLKVYRIPEANRTSAGRSLPNVLQLKPEEKISSVIPVREFTEGHHLLMATKNGLVKKSSLADYSRVRAGGIIGIALEEGDALIGVVLTRPGDEIILSTRNGMAIRFQESDAREMGRNTKGVKGISLGRENYVVGMVVADPEGMLLTVCEYGYAKRTPIGQNSPTLPEVPEGEELDAEAEEPETSESMDGDSDSPSGTAEKSAMRYRLQRRGGKGTKDVKVTEKNGPVVGIASVRPGDDVIVVTVQGMVIRARVDDIRLVGRNTQGVRIMNLNEGDRIVVFAKVASEIAEASRKEAPATEGPAPEASNG
jgi:DNA gyrase subunit A